LHRNRRLTYDAAMSERRRSQRKPGLLTISAAVAALVWLVGGLVLTIMLGQQARLEADAQHIYDVSSAKVFEATRTIRGLERLAREGDAILWIADPVERTARRQRLGSLLDDAALQGDPDIRDVVHQAFAALDHNLADLQQHGTEAQGRSAARWTAPMQRLINKSEAVGAEVSDLATREADQILLSTENARALLLWVTAATAVGSLVFFGIIYFMLTRPVVRLAAALNHARDGKPIPQRKVAIRELQMLQDAALALGEAHRELETVRGQLELQAHTDALTDLANRRMFELQGQQAFFHAQRYGEAMSVIVLDIDHFKRINDQFGHEGGDVVLRALGRYLKEAVRASERPAARIGGEEFAILVSHSTEEEPLLFA
jgi:hypothetical protein